MFRRERLENLAWCDGCHGDGGCRGDGGCHGDVDYGDYSGCQGNGGINWSCGGGVWVIVIVLVMVISGV